MWWTDKLITKIRSKKEKWKQCLNSRTEDYEAEGNKLKQQ